MRISDKIVITRKAHICCTCERYFEKGIKMRTQIRMHDEILIWRECPTCTQLLKKYFNFFEQVNGEFIYGCVKEKLEVNQTPEELLKILDFKNKIGLLSYFKI